MGETVPVLICRQKSLDCLASRSALPHSRFWIVSILSASVPRERCWSAVDSLALPLHIFDVGRSSADRLERFRFKSLDRLWCGVGMNIYSGTQSWTSCRQVQYSVAPYRIDYIPARTALATHAFVIQIPCACLFSAVGIGTDALPVMDCAE